MEMLLDQVFCCSGQICYILPSILSRYPVHKQLDPGSQYCCSLKTTGLCWLDTFPYPKGFHGYLEQCKQLFCLPGSFPCCTYESIILLPPSCKIESQFAWSSRLSFLALLSMWISQSWGDWNCAVSPINLPCLIDAWSLAVDMFGDQGYISFWQKLWGGFYFSSL